jgi:hypothetical protein
MVLLAPAALPAEILIPAALPTSIGPYVAVMAVGFLIGVAGHMIRSRLLVLTGILIIGTVSVIVAFVIGKLGQ